MNDRCILWGLVFTKCRQPVRSSIKISLKINQKESPREDQSIGCISDDFLLLVLLRLDRLIKVPGEMFHQRQITHAYSAVLL